MVEEMINLLAFDYVTFLSYCMITMELLVCLFNIKVLHKAFHERSPRKRGLIWMTIAILALFASFIVICGMTHFLNALRRSFPANETFAELLKWVSGFCAGISLLTALVGLYVFPAALRVFNSFELTEEGKLKRMEDDLTDTLELFEESIVVLDGTTTNIKRGNGVTETYFGSDFVGSSVSCFMHPEDIHAFRFVVAEVSKHGCASLDDIAHMTGVSRGKGAASLIWQYRLRTPKHPLDYFWVESSIRRRNISSTGCGSDEAAPLGDLEDGASRNFDHFFRDMEETRLLGRSDCNSPRIFDLPAAVRSLEVGNSSPRSLSASSPFELVMITRDINERKESEELQKRIKANEEQAKTNEGKLRYIAGIAHDLKTPLQSFTSSIDVLKATALTKEQKEVLEEAQVACELMKLTISQTQGIGKLLTGGKLVPRRSTVQLSSLLKRVRIVIKGLGTQVPVSYSIAPDIGDFVLSDEEWLWQMILNLLTNAGKYTDEGEIRVSISLKHPAEGAMGARSGARDGMSTQTMLLFEVIDTGIGVNESKIGSLFQPFSMVQEGQMQGTGLGLYGLRCRAEGLGGTCGVHSNEAAASGSVFWFQVPYVEDTSSAQVCFDSLSISSASSRDIDAAGDRAIDLSASIARDSSRSFRDRKSSACTTIPASSVGTSGNSIFFPSSSSSSSSSASKRPIDPLSVSVAAAPSDPDFPIRQLSAIVVDDVPMICKILERVLKQLGFKSIECYPNGKKGLDAMMAKEVDIVFSDVQMPVLSGPEMVERFRAFEANEMSAGRRQRRQIVVAVTANGDEFHTELVGPNRFDQMSPKPVNKRGVRLLLNDLLGLSIAPGAEEEPELV